MADDRSDDTNEAMGGTRWVSYAELAKLRGITKASATRLAMRRAWDRQPGNDGLARVAVPIAALKPDTDDAHDAIHDATQDDRGAIGHDDGDANLSVIKALEAHVESLRDRLVAADSEAKALRDRLSETERDREALRQDREDARVRTATAEGEAKALREALGEAQRPFWHRWIGR